MLIFLLLLLLLIFHGIQFASENSFAKDYMDKDRTNAIKGIFVILIVFSHYSQYVDLSGVLDEPYLVFQDHLHQMVVAMFWFYSGYGIMESISRKGFSYVKSIMTKRFPMVLINFDIAVILFLITDFFLGRKYDLVDILLSFVGWSSVGNSNWYIFVTLVLYILVFLSFYGIKYLGGGKGKWTGAVMLVLLSLAFVFIMMILERPTRFYNTTILFSFGVWFSLLRKKIEMVVMKNDFVYMGIGAAFLFMYFVAYRNRWNYGIEGYTIWALLFTSLVVLITMKITFFNGVLVWFGNHVFSVYILQRIPMMVLQKAGVAESNKYFFLVLVIVSTILSAMIFDYITNALWKRVYGAKRVKKKGEEVG